MLTIRERLFQKAVRTEITFDFHRLGVLLLRAAVEDGNVVARKIATATLCEAKIQATVGTSSQSLVLVAFELILWSMLTVRGRVTCHPSTSRVV